MTDFSYTKKPFGAGVTPEATAKFFIQTRVSPENITIQVYEAFKKNEDFYDSLATAYHFSCEVLNAVVEKPELNHSEIFTPQNYGGLDIIHGPAFGLDPSLYFLARGSITLNKSADALGVNKSTLWAPHSNIFIVMDEFGRIRNPYNKYPHSMISKVDSTALLMDKFVHGIAQIYLSHHEESFDGDGLRITVHPDLGHDSNIEFDQIVSNDPAAYGAFAENFLPVINAPAEIVCPAGQVVDIPIRVMRPNGLPYSGDCHVYSKCDTGFVVTRKVNALDGVAVIRYMALGLESGASAEIKIGFKWYENKATTGVTIQ